MSDLSNDKKTVLIAEEYNAGKGTVKEICKRHNITDRTFQKYTKELGIERVDNKYIIPTGISELQGQIDLLEQEESKDKGKSHITKVEDEEKATYKAGMQPQGKKKKTYEIDIAVDIGVKIAASMQQKTMNEYVNEVLKDSIPQEIKEMIQDGGI